LVSISETLHRLPWIDSAGVILGEWPESPTTLGDLRSRQAAL
jgi:hypothetical protein